MFVILDQRGDAEYISDGREAKSRLGILGFCRLMMT